jgi:hypothetical protein
MGNKCFLCIDNSARPNSISISRGEKTNAGYGKKKLGTAKHKRLSMIYWSFLTPFASQELMIVTAS